MHLMSVSSMATVRMYVDPTVSATTDPPYALNRWTLLLVVTPIPAASGVPSVNAARVVVVDPDQHASCPAAVGHDLAAVDSALNGLGSS